jgi:RNA polymerase sigma-70 factor (ECF subfamily)
LGVAIFPEHLNFFGVLLQLFTRGQGLALEASAFDALYRELAPRVRAYLRQLVTSYAVAEDLTQEIFTQFWLRPDGFDVARGSLSSYLFGMARHMAGRWRDARNTDLEVEERATAEDWERNRAVADAMARLPEEQRSLLWLREVEGQSYDELALILGIPVGTVRSRLFAARMALRKIWLGAKRNGEMYGVR